MLIVGLIIGVIAGACLGLVVMARLMAGPKESEFAMSIEDMDQPTAEDAARRAEV